MTNPNNSDPNGFSHPEGYSEYNPQPEAGNHHGVGDNGTYGPDFNSPLGNGYGTSNPDSAFSNDYASYGPAGAAGYGAPVQEQNGMALAALIVGIIALFSIFFAPVAALAGIAAIILGVLGLRKAKAMAPGNNRRGMSIAGIVTGAIALLLAIALMAFLGTVINEMVNSGLVEQCEHLQNDPEAFEACVTDFMENNPDSPLNTQGSSQ
ncbi:DUF4190 domain-containing protein [Corynebacterium qintianiae]|uniref:DUF4190 domain-containing protein n=1 Tax=Corynebacterium qintianiae TaxID=2709392 RepID=UPI0013EB3659|nr:DUF4190 domain-containing protein [Corynebacterium qintianiae]